MKRRWVTALGLAAVATWWLKPSARGGPYTPYFAALNAMLKAQGPGRPVMVIDLDRLDANCAKVRAKLPADKAFRVVAKSLPSPRLIAYVAAAMRTRRLMVFHQPHLNALVKAEPSSDLLLGKPMPIHAAAGFYRELGAGGFDPSQQLQWLVDTPERLAQYAQLAQGLNTRLRINVEIDVGLHRGGAQTPGELLALLEGIAADPAHLEFAGLMGYDAHVGKIPSLVESRDTSFARACMVYREMREAVRMRFPQWVTERTVYNGAGSPTLRLHNDPRSVLNELSAGSCLVKPTDFDLDLLADLEPAAFIATPVLKVLQGTHLPGLGKASDLISAWDPNCAKSYFIYGGLWQTQYASPLGLQDNALYGKSSNQAIVNSSDRVPLEVDDHVFLRPTQSERVLLEFGDLAVVRGGRLIDWWPVLPT